MCTVNLHYGENNVNVGPLKEIPQICVDHFFGDDLKSSAFFLSHAHTDHMVGLESAEFVRRLDDPGVRLYCQALTPVLLGAFSRYLGGQDGLEKLIRGRKLVPLDTGIPYKLEVPSVPDDLIVTVTLLPAGHCPGSVMFLFETNSIRVLHTGDFRLTLDDLKSFNSLHVGQGQYRKPKKIDHLYVDTTFCSKSASLFPCRKEVIQKAIEHVKEWTSLSERNWVFIKFAAKFAHEYILLELFKTFGKKIHVAPDRLEIYTNIPGLSEVVTLDTRTPFHFCGNRRCIDGESMEMRLSSMWYTISSSSTKVCETVMRTSKRLSVCYSMHSSLSEIAETIDYLKPSVVTPLVMPFQSNLKEVKEALEERCKVRFTYEDYRSSGTMDVKRDMPVRVKENVVVIDQPELESDEEEENIINSQESDIIDDAFETEKLSDKYKWKFSFSPSPTRKSYLSESSSSSQNPSSQEEKDSQEFNSPLQDIDKIPASPTTPTSSNYRAISGISNRKRMSDGYISSLVTNKKLNLHMTFQENGSQIASSSKDSDCSGSFIDLTNESSGSDRDSNASNSKELLPLL